MGFIDWEEEKGMLEINRRRLARRGLILDLKQDWEVHGPHKDMDYCVYVGYVLDGMRESFCVVMYPHIVYQIEDPDDWWNPKEENRIMIEAKPKNSKKC